MQLEEITKELTKYDTTTAAIAELSRQYMALEIKGIDDKEGFQLVHTARMNVKSKRVAVEKRAKELRADAVRFQKECIAVEKGIILQLQPIEDHLSDEENRVEEEKARLRAEAAAKEAARVKVLVDKLYSLGCRFDGTAWTFNDVPVTTQVQLIGMPEEQFAGVTKAIQTALDEEKEAKAAEQERIAKVTAEQEKERIRLAEEAKRIKEEQDRITAEQAKERERLAAEAKAIQDEKDRLAREAKAAEDAKLKAEQDKIRAAEMEKAKAEAAEKAAKETTERIQRETEAKWTKDLAEIDERIRKEEKARLAAERKAARQPDRVKLASFLDRHFGQIEELQLKTDEGKSACEAIWAILQTAEHDCREIVEKL